MSRTVLSFHTPLNCDLATSLNRPCRFVSFVRDPIDYFVSLWRDSLRIPHLRQAMSGAGATSLSHCAVVGCVGRPNTQSLQLCGLGHTFDRNASASAALWAADLETCTFERVTQNVRRRVIVLGVTEEYDRTMRVLKKVCTRGLTSVVVAHAAHASVFLTGSRQARA
jgi:hypothetical protein